MKISWGPLKGSLSTELSQETLNAELNGCGELHRMLAAEFCRRCDEAEARVLERHRRGISA